jgi:hypothetical protein
MNLKTIGDFFFRIICGFALASKYYHISSKEAAELTLDAFRNYCMSL